MYAIPVDSSAVVELVLKDEDERRSQRLRTTSNQRNFYKDDRYLCSLTETIRRILMKKREFWFVWSVDNSKSDKQQSKDDDQILILVVDIREERV